MLLRVMRRRVVILKKKEGIYNLWLFTLERLQVVFLGMTLFLMSVRKINTRPLV